MQIDVIFDTVCPWCFIGKRRLDKALALRPDLSPEIKWRPFLLNPHMPGEGVDQDAYLVRKFGSENRVRRIFGAINEVGQSVEIEFSFDRISRMPNSVLSHRLIKVAGESRLAGVCVEAVFKAFFIDGLDIGDPIILAEIGGRIGMNSPAIRSYLESNDDVDWVRTENAHAHRTGINGVPAFVVDGCHAISGAQEAPVLSRLLDAALAMEVSPVALHAEPAF
jgi:predicted DsbA family dithiol-disulfide isomerase